ncbi:tyrosine-type recombinase/integrase [Bdellovibrionota bacterium FG-2]
MSVNFVKMDGRPQLILEFYQHQKEIQCVNECTIYQRLLHVDPFLKSLGPIGSPERIGELTSSYVHDYVMKVAPAFSRRYRKEFLCSLRSFFKFLVFRDYSDIKIIHALPKLPTWSLSEIPRGISWDSVQKLLEMPNRNKPNGKRNYALLLLLATYGVRYSQARKLRLKDIHWDEEVLHFRPCKGGKPLCFPLYEKVAEALLDYIENGRGRYEIEEVFLQKKTLPPAPLGSGLHSTMKWYYEKAGINAHVTGFHAIRHAFATKLTKENVPIKNIADLLGHRSIKSSYIYTKVDIDQLRSLCREWPEVLS